MPGQPIGLAVSAAEQEHERVVGQVLQRRAAVPTRAIGSGMPVSFRIELADSRSRPAGATIRLHQLPKPSR